MNNRSEYNNKMNKNKILILGASGMLGNAMLKSFSQDNSYQVNGTIRSKNKISYFPKNIQHLLISNVNVENNTHLINVFEEIKPDVVINCIGLIKQLDECNDPISVIPINSLFPHKLNQLSSHYKARLIHFSTDCVFSGKQGMYKENDLSDANDLYGRTKYLGEVKDKNAITLRTSIIGHELSGSKSLVDWALSQTGEIKGFKEAIFSGLPTYELSNLVRDYVVPNKKLKGLFHVASDPINKLELLRLIYKIYGKNIKIIPDSTVVINRSLDPSKFNNLTGYKSPTWTQLIKGMYINENGEYKC